GCRGRSRFRRSCQLLSGRGEGRLPPRRSRRLLAIEQVKMRRSSRHTGADSHAFYAQGGVGRRPSGRARGGRIRDLLGPAGANARDQPARRGAVRPATLAVLALVAAGPVVAQQPLSAIPWLSESVRIEATAPPARPVI